MKKVAKHTSEKEKNKLSQIDIKKLNEKLEKIIDKTEIENSALKKIIKSYCYKK